MKRYILRPGWVTSRHDGDRHYIKAPALARLYDVPMGECVVIPQGQSLVGFHEIDRFKILCPRANGKYRPTDEGT